MQWSYNDGYWPENRSRSSASVLKQDGDCIQGPKFDTGLGSYRSREAFHRGRKALRKAEVNLAAALMNQGTNVQRALVGPGKRWIELITSCKWRTEQLLPFAPSQTMHHTIAASGIIWKALGALQASQAGSSKPSTPTVEMCETCTIRLATRKKDGLRCDTCYKYRLRTGKERPRSRDKHIANINQEALERAKQRRAAGLGYGAS